MPSETVKQRAIYALEALPEDATIDAIERLCLIAKIEEGLSQADAGQLADQQEPLPGMTTRWTAQAIADLAAIRVFIAQDSPHYSPSLSIA